MDKKQLIKKLLNKEMTAKKDVIKELQTKYNKKNYSDIELQLSLIENEACFKYYNHSRRKNYYYFVSNIGRVLLINIEAENNIEEMEIKEFPKDKCWIIPQNTETLCLDIDWFKQKYEDFCGYILNSSTPVYTMVGEVWLADEYKKMNEAYPDERIELHHIDGNNLNCKIDNLIYIPNHIHAIVHTKINP